MVKVDGCKLCDAYDACLYDVTVNNVVKRKAFLDEWKTVYRSMMPSKVLDFLRNREKTIKEAYKIEIDRFRSPTLRLCIFINALNAYPGRKITNTLRSSLIKEVKEALDFIPTLKTQLKEKFDKQSVDEALEALTELTNHQKSEQQKVIQRLLQTSKALREDPKTNLMSRYELNQEFINILKEGQYASPQIAEYFLEEGNDWYKLSRIHEAIEWIKMAKLIFNRLEWDKDVSKCEQMIEHLKNIP